MHGLPARPACAARGIIKGETEMKTDIKIMKKIVASKEFALQIASSVFDENEDEYTLCENGTVELEKGDGLWTQDVSSAKDLADDIQALAELYIEDAA